MTVSLQYCNLPVAQKTAVVSPLTSMFFYIHRTWKIYRTAAVETYPFLALIANQLSDGLMPLPCKDMQAFRKYMEIS